MDSVTQFALGAAIGQAMLGKRMGRQATLLGGCLGTLPDLDVLIPLNNAVASFTYHRSLTHSLFVLAIITPLLAYWLRRSRFGANVGQSFACWVIYLIFATHVFIDSLTAYGTQIFWPIITTPVSISSLFIIDPFYTVPLLIGLVCAQLARLDASWGRLTNHAGLVLSTLYLVFSLTAKYHVEQKLASQLETQGIEAKSWFTTPTPFNTLLWRAVIMSDNGYYEAYYSLLDGSVPIRFEHYPSESDLLETVSESWAVQRLQWFTGGFYSVRQDEQNLIISDLRMGVEPNYVFRFVVAQMNQNEFVEVDPIKVSPERDFSILKSVWARIWDPQIVMSHEKNIHL